MESIKTVIQFIDYAIDKYADSDATFWQGSESPWNEAIIFAASIFNVDPWRVDEGFLENPITNRQRDTLITLLNERINKRIPAAYLLKHAWFAGYNFYIDDRVIIPRSPFAELIEKQFSPWVEPGRVHNIIDICTGSGCMAIALAKRFPNAKVTAVDLSKDALEVAKMNIKHHKVEKQVTLVYSDLLDDVPLQKFDLMVTNPPYVPPKQMDELPVEFSFEPRVSMIAEDNGIALAKRIIDTAPKYLRDGSAFVIEVGYQMSYLEDAYPKMPIVWFELQRGGVGIGLVKGTELINNVRK